MAWSGGCYCGAVTWSCAAEPTRNLVCHCEDCRRALSAPMMASLGFPKDHVQWSGEIRHFHSSPEADRGFCGTCGSRLYFASKRWPDEQFIMASTLADHSAYWVTKHVVTDEMVPWVHLKNVIPGTGFDKTPEDA